MNTIKSISVFCGSNLGMGEAYMQAARELGKSFAKLGITLVYGGANIGLMGEIGNAALDAGANVIGVMPQFLVDKEIAHKGLSDFKIVKTMHERKALMAELSDAFIIMPGGYGSLDEFFEACTWTQLGFQHKICAILNVDNYFGSLLAFLDHAVHQEFVKKPHREMLVVESNPQLIIETIKSYDLPAIGKWF